MILTRKTQSGDDRGFRLGKCSLLMLAEPAFLSETSFVLLNTSDDIYSTAIEKILWQCYSFIFFFFLQVNSV
jgi:hypothetical protein